MLHFQQQEKERWKEIRRKRGGGGEWTNIFLVILLNI